MAQEATLTPIPVSIPTENASNEAGTDAQADGDGFGDEMDAYDTFPTDADGYLMDETITLYCGEIVSAHQFQYPELASELISQETMDSWKHSDAEQMRYDSQIAIDEIFVRYGWDFSHNEKRWAQDLVATYSGRSWYSEALAERPSDDQYVLITQYMSEADRSNVEAIQAWQNENVPPEEE